MKFRYGEKQDPVLMQPGKVYAIDIESWNTSYILNAGHSLRLQITSASHPQYNANPNNGLPLNDKVLLM